MEKRLFEVDIASILDSAGYFYLSRSEKEAIIEIAFLSMTLDEKITRDEIDAFQRNVEKLDDPNVSREKVWAIFGKFDKRLEQSDTEKRILEVSRPLGPKADSIGYAVAQAIFASDFELAREEQEFTETFRIALNISKEDAEKTHDSVIDSTKTKSN